ncbi:uncharacterized protein PV09_05206 [Verruconis gallopava]|uniref:OsmC-like protein n=1 Tax=Verruconis gallopava TaxID=253628 RepID=A0A0D1XLZ8_9PEZI|nr:uncharacterized protein PV09_05206 [Verruconis gallopava]KIW03436.1 hypothetical protein PV09_05206 [Verruconis gallopava]
MAQPTHATTSDSHCSSCACGHEVSERAKVTTSSLREKQAPIKDLYKKDPSKAFVTLSAQGTLSNTSIACKLSSGAAIKEATTRVAGLHPKAGGDNPDVSGELCSGDMLLEALVACAGVTMKAVATALSLPLKDGNIRAEGDLDFRGTLGIDRDAPVGFKEIRMSFDVSFENEISEEQVERLGKLTERYCVVLQTIAKKPEIKLRVRGAYESEDGIERAELWARST